jgi:polar amino acid transport system substrate-binding protein
MARCETTADRRRRAGRAGRKEELHHMQHDRFEDLTSAPSLRRRAMRVRPRSLVLTVSAVLAAGALAACGSSSSSSSTSSSAASTGAATSSSAASSTTAAAAGVTVDGQTITTDAKLAAMVPASVKKTGLLDITYNNAPPDEAVVGGSTVGWEVDLGKAVAAELGIPWKITTSGNFDSFIPGLQNGRYNTSFTSFIQTPARLKQIDIVTYYDVGTGFAVKQGSSLSIKSPTDLCGHTVAVLEGSAFIQQIQSIKCGSKPAIKVSSFPSDSAAELAVSSGRAQVYSSSEDQLSYLIDKTAHQFVLQPLDFDTVPEGAGVTKGSGLTKTVALAMDQLITSGAYSAIMKKWSLTEGLVKKATIYSDTK